MKQNEAPVTHGRKLIGDPIVRILLGVLLVSATCICCYLVSGSCLLGGALHKSNQTLDRREHLPIDQIVIDESPFPDGWSATEPSTDFPPLAPWTTGRDEVAYVSRRFYDSSGQSGVAGITAQRFRRVRDAVKEYEHGIDVTFRIRDEENQTPWSVPEPLSSFKSSSADRYRYACSTIFSQVRCSYVAQYEVYTVVLNSSLYDTDVFTYTDLLPVFHAIDERVTFALEEAE